MNTADDTDGTDMSGENQNLIVCIAGAQDGSIPDEIQYMPPGKHTITAHRDGKPATVTIQVNSSVAGRLQAAIAKMISGGREPYIDFNHGDGAAAGWIQSLRWAGDDPVTGGIRAKINWTDAGRKALEGRDYRKFSPTFTLNAAGEIDGTSVNAGGLVNRPAFKQLTIVASDGAATNQRTVVNEEQMKARIAEQDAEIKSLKDQLTAVNAKLADQAKMSAKAAVQAAITSGKLPSKDTALHAKWEALITSNPDSAEILAGMPQREVPPRLIQASAEDRQNASANNSADHDAARQVALNEYRAAHPGCTHDQAWAALRGMQPALFAVATA